MKMKKSLVELSYFHKYSKLVQIYCHYVIDIFKHDRDGLNVSCLLKLSFITQSSEI